MDKVLKRVMKNKKLVKCAGLVAVLLILVIVLSIVFSNGGKKSYALYLKDKEICYAGTASIKPWQVTTKFVDTDEIDSSDLADVATYLGMYTKVSPDGKKVFFFDKVTEDGGSLYYRRVNKSKKEPVKIASNVTEFVLNKDADRVLYLKEGVLYQYDMKKSKEFVKDVEDFYVSEEGKQIVYMNSDDENYFKIGDKNAEKIDSDITRNVNVSEACAVVHYLKADNLFKKESGKEKVKIASDVYSVPKIYETGELYFLKEEMQEFALNEYVEDDMKEKDANLKEPKESDYEDDNEFQDAYYEYYERTEREELRLQLEDGTLETSTYELFYYNGKKAESIAKGTASSIDVAEEKAVVVYSVYDKSEVDKVKLSEVDYMFEIEDLVEEALFASSKCYVAVGKKTSEIKQKDAYDFELDADGKTLYFIDNISSETNHGELYRARISGSKVKNPEKMEKDVYKYGAGYISEGQYVYYKNVDDEGDSGKMYMNHKQIDSDVNLYNAIYVEEAGILVYMKDWNDDKDFGTLKMRKGNKTTKIASKVYDYNILPNGEVLFLTEYDEEKAEGTLSIFKNNKVKKIDHGVTAILPIYE